MELSRFHYRWLSIVALVGWALLAADQAIPFQLRIHSHGNQEEAASSVSFPSDRLLMQRLSKAQELLDEQRYAEAVRSLGSILEHSEDAFFLPEGIGKEATYRSIKAEAEQVLGQIPEAGRESYELQFGSAARQMLDQAAQQGNLSGLAEVSRRFFHTAAGYEATDLLGTCYMQAGQPLAAALCFQRLQRSSHGADQFEPMLSVKLAICWSRSGMHTEAEKILQQLEDRNPQASFQIAGQAYTPFVDHDPMDVWLTSIAKPQARPNEEGVEEWAVHRGGPARNATSAGGSPLLSHRWAVPTSNDPHIENAVEQIQLASADEGIALLPSWHPLAVRNYVFMRSLQGLVAIDFTTGKRVWHGPTDESMRQLIEPRGQGTSSGISALAAGWLNDRIWGNSAYGTMSSDGKSVFCLEDFGQPNNLYLRNGQAVHLAGRNFGGMDSEAHNRLAAYDIATEGKLKWDLGGPAGEGDVSFSHHYFLGPPLPLDRRLYALAEVKNEIRLMCLDADDGSVLWSQRLADTEVSVSDDPIRRSAGASPSYSDGVLICPTSAGAVVAVDLTTRSLLWAYRYGRTYEPTDAMMTARLQMRAMMENNMAEMDRWTDATATIAEGHVILTPPESNELHCLSLLDGKLLWKQPREDGLYVGCIYKDNVFVVGRSHLRSLRLENGESSWTENSTSLPSTSMPSGRGFFSGDRYFLPLTTAEVASIALDSGKILSRSKSRSGAIIGNLICHNGSVLSQGITALESFYQLDDLQQQVAASLAKNPVDPTALALRGELYLNEDQHDRAISSLQQAFDLAPEPHTRDLLINAMLEGLKIDFAKYRLNADKLDKLIERPDQRLAYLREYGAGLQSVGEIMPAFETYLKIVDLPSDSDELERLDHSRSIRRSCWLRARLREIADQATPDDTQRIEGVLRQRLQIAIQSEILGPLREFVEYFGSHPLANEAREELADRSMGTVSSLEIELLLRQLVQGSADDVQIRGAEARLARLLVRANRLPEAEPFLRKLAGPYAKLACLDGKNGQQVMAELLGKKGLDSVTQRTAHAWPLGKVEHHEIKTRQTPFTHSIPVNMQEVTEPFFDSTTVEFDPSRQSLVGQDGCGREQWRVSLNERGERNNFVHFNSNLNRAFAQGHLLLISLGSQLVAIDTLGGPGSEGPGVLWRQDLTEVMPGMPQGMGINSRQMQLPWGVQQSVAVDSLGRPLGNVGPLTPEFLCFQRQRSLFAVHPLTGETLWIRHGMPPGSDLFGDEEMVFITPPNSSNAIVVSALDGHELGQRTVPPLEQRLMLRGRYVLTWNNHHGNKKSLIYRDLWDSKILWEKNFDAGAKPWPIGDSGVGVLDRKGHFLIVSVPDGEVELESRVDPIPSLSSIVVFRTPERDLLIASEPMRSRNGVTIQPLPGGFGNILISGTLYGFSRPSGKLEFSATIENCSLVANQPADLPFLTFGAQVYHTSNNPSRTSSPSPEAMVLCIDKRTGRKIYDDKSTGPISTVDVIGDPDKNEATLQTLRGTVQLIFTNKPVVEESDQEADQKGKSEP